VKPLLALCALLLGLSVQAQEAFPGRPMRIGCESE
jgi:hypothetical protein